MATARSVFGNFLAFRLHVLCIPHPRPRKSTPAFPIRHCRSRWGAADHKPYSDACERGATGTTATTSELLPAIDTDSSLKPHRVGKINDLTARDYCSTVQLMV